MRTFELDSAEPRKVYNTQIDQDVRLFKTVDEAIAVRDAMNLVEIQNRGIEDWAIDALLAYKQNPVGSEKPFVYLTYEQTWLGSKSAHERYEINRLFIKMTNKLKALVVS